ncbi:MAG: hypothetical protein ABW167_10380 [Baekduia sp.]
MTVQETEERHRSNGAVDLRRMTVQSGPTTSTVPSWSPGPAPFAIQRCVVDDDRYQFWHGDAGAAERSRHASSMLSERLHAPSARWHRAALATDQLPSWTAASGRPAASDPRVVAVELLRIAAPIADAPNGLLVIHARPTPSADDLVQALRMLTLRHEHSATWIEHLLRGSSASPAGQAHRPHHLCFAIPEGALADRDRRASDMHWTPEEQWLWLLTTLHDEADYPVSTRNQVQIQRAQRPLSGDWTCAMMRHGTAFLGRSLDDEWEYDDEQGRFRLTFLAEMAPLLVRSLYADAIAFGVAKDMLLHDFDRDLAALGDPITCPHQLAALESRFTRFRNALWWEDTGLSGHATLLLRNYGLVHGHKAKFDRLVSDFTDYSQKVERTELARSNELSSGTNALVGLVTCFGVPLAALDTFGTGSSTVWIVVAAYLALLAFLPAGDLVIGPNLPSSLGSDKARARARVAWAVAWVGVVATLLLTAVLPIDDRPSPPSSGVAVRHR